MKQSFAILLLASSFPASCIAADQASSLVFSVEDAKRRPVAKVTALLKDMLNQLEKETAEDEEIYDKMACWCETNDKEKTKSITKAQDRIQDLSTEIGEFTASAARLGTEIKTLEKEISTNQNALDQATSIRQKQQGEFNDEEKDLTQSVSALKASTVVLSKHHSEALIQMPQSHMLRVVDLLKHEMKKHSALLQGVLTHSERRTLASFIEASSKSHAPPSAEVYGILKQMQDTFNSNLEASKKEETANQNSFEDLKDAKNDQIKAGQDQVDVKMQKLARTEQKLARAKQDMEETKDALSSDEEFLVALKSKCSMSDKEWEQRQQTRQSEMGAVSKALEILSSDDAKDTFSKTFNPSLFQKQSSRDSLNRSQASKLLKIAAQKLSNPRFAALAIQVRLDAFTRVKKAIDDLVAELTKEKAEEIKHKDWCVEEFNTNQLQTEKKERKKEDLVTKNEDLEMEIRQLSKTIETLKAEIVEMQLQIKRAGEDREVENKDFQRTVVDQRAAQKLLEAAVGVLKDFYSKGATPTLIQQSQPAGFEAYTKSAASGGVIDLLEQIIADAKKVEAEVIRSEQDSQKAYEDMVKDTVGSVETKSREIVNKSELKARAEGDLVALRESKETVLAELEDLSNYNIELHQSCDFVMKNFELRQTARDEELQTLKQAKAILSGAKFAEFLQKS